MWHQAARQEVSELLDTPDKLPYNEIEENDFSPIGHRTANLLREVRGSARPYGRLPPFLTVFEVGLVLNYSVT
jgi:hypothetical protein